jgi:carbonic anhydrase
MIQRLFPALTLAASVFYPAAGDLFGKSAGPGLSAAEALERLKEGNARFVAGASEHPRIDAKRLKETTEGGQHPFATVIGCSDSRAGIELLFDQGVGDVFVIRVAGNVIGTNEAGSIEYGVDNLGTPLFVVLGHTHCGAVTAVVEGARVGGNIPKLVEPIGPAAEKARQKHPGAKGEELVAHAIEANVFQSIESILTISETVRERVESGQLKIVGALYNIETGEVDWLGEHPDQAELLATAEAGALLDSAPEPAPAHAGHHGHAH